MNIDDVKLGQCIISNENGAVLKRVEHGWYVVRADADEDFWELGETYSEDEPSIDF